VLLDECKQESTEKGSVSVAASEVSKVFDERDFRAFYLQYVMKQRGRCWWIAGGAEGCPRGSRGIHFLLREHAALRTEYLCTPLIASKEFPLQSNPASRNGSQAGQLMMEFWPGWISEEGHLTVVVRRAILRASSFRSRDFLIRGFRLSVSSLSNSTMRAR
jgi:hypothetical protein